MTDHGDACRSHDFRTACTSAGVRHLRTRPYTPRTILGSRPEDQAERFLQTVMRECADAHAFRSSHERAAALPRWLHLYHVHRPHTALARHPPISRLAINNPLGHDSWARDLWRVPAACCFINLSRLRSQLAAALPAVTQP